MERTDYVFLALIALFSVWQIFVIVRARKGIVLHATSPGRMGGVVLCLVILAIAIWRRGNFLTAWPVYAALLVMMALYMLAPVGMASKCFYSATRRIGYDDLVYYNFENPANGLVRVRLARSAGRETIFSIPEDEQGRAERWLLDSGVDDFEGYSAQVRGR